MQNPQSGPELVGSAPFLPHVPKRGEDRSVVSLLRLLPDGCHVAVWSHRCGTPREADTLFGWMWTQASEWPVWGRTAVRLGEGIVSPIILEGAQAAADAAAHAAANRERAEAERRRLARQITLWVFDSKKKRPSLGLERGCDDAPFWRMTFAERWERDRVADWLKFQKHRYVDFEALFLEHGDLELERLVLSGMRETEADVKRRGLSAGGRRPLRFWRGE